jgi:hypothetical protein
MSNRRCFISAPYGLDLSALQRALEERGVDWQWAEDLPTGVPLMEAASKAIQRADFLLAISSESTLSPNSFLEIGYALGREIPVVLLTTESFDVPIDLATLRHLKTDLNDPKLLSFQVQLLLSSLDLPKGKARVSKFDCILETAPAMFSVAQLRVFLRALVNIDPYTFDDVAEQLAADHENNQQTSEEILLSTIDGLPDDKLTGFALRLVLTAHTPIPREGEIDLLTEAETAFAPAQPKKTATKKAKASTPIKAAQKTAAKKTTARKQVAA